MKKLLAILLAGLMVLSIAACSNKEKDKENDDEKYRDNTVIVDSLTEGTDTFRFENVDSETVIIAEFSTTLDKAHEVKIPAYLMVPGNEREQEPDKYLRVVGVGKVPYISVKLDPHEPVHEYVIPLIKFYIEKFNQNN